ncbi:uncharacterized protein LAJ45_04752 [Morchella importuna]|uniref:uncharacterized protein n=1 Tax=Morchella importuna TaxID=1174673 RepID=UPI001E8EA5D8|nr:uncharacterized protein LAJ45_04752 [Morchella importuna]KAH8151051.1 hypothetical protein LAJ45_04752 [Morchella importuna]
MSVPYKTRFFKRQYSEAATSPSEKPDGFSSPGAVGDDGGVRLRDSGDEKEGGEGEEQEVERAPTRKKRKISCAEALRALRTIEVYFTQEGLDPQEEFFPDFLQMRGGIVRAGAEQAGSVGKEGKVEVEEEEESDPPSEVSSSPSFGSAYSGDEDGEGED